MVMDNSLQAAIVLAIRSEPVNAGIDRILAAADKRASASQTSLV